MKLSTWDMRVDNPGGLTFGFYLYRNSVEGWSLDVGLGFWGFVLDFS